MKKAIGKMVYINRSDRLFGSTDSHLDFEVNTITSNSESSYHGLKVDGSDFHCMKKFWKYQAYNSPQVPQVLPQAGKTMLMNFYDRSGDNWEKVKILFVGQKLFVYECDDLESSAYIEGNEFRNLEKN